MRNLFKYITFIVLSIPFLAFATPVSWDYTTNLLQPLRSGMGAEVRVPYVTSTSTTNNNTLPRLVATNATTTYATTTNLAITTALNLFGGGALTTNNALCIQLTGSAGLCDGSDATGGGGGGSISTSSIPVAGNLAYWTSDSTLSDVATGTLTEGITGLEFTATRGLVGGSAILNLSSGYAMFLTASGTNWNTFYDTPSTRITAGDALTWTSNTMNFDGGATPAGDLGGTWASPSVTDDSHAHTGATLSGIDISSDTNLSGDTEVVLTGDALSLGNALTFTSATATNLGIATNINLFGGGNKSTANELCIQLTGSADLCDGSDGGGGGSSKWTDGTNFTYLTNTTYDLGLGSSLPTTSSFWWDVSASQLYVGSQGSTDGLITFGTTTPWTIGFDDTDDSFAISSSTSLGTFNALTITSTTSVMNATTSTGSRVDEGVRMSIGGDDAYLGLTQPLDHLTLRGRMRNQDWVNFSCYQASVIAQVTADGVLQVCPQWYFAEDGTSYLSSVNSTGYTYNQLGSITANDGGMLVLHSASNATNWMTLATNTPSMEVTARIGTIVSNSSTTQYYIGYLPWTINVTVLENDPSSGCYFWVASSTAGAIANNWLATCKTSTSATTTVDTGIASTSVATGAGEWYVFRIDATGEEVNFYIKPGNQAMRKVATINTNIPQTTLSPNIYFGRRNGTQAIQFDFFNLDVWLRKVYPLNT